MRPNTPEISYSKSELEPNSDNYGRNLHKEMLDAEKKLVETVCSLKSLQNLHSILEPITDLQNEEVQTNALIYVNIHLARILRDNCINFIKNQLETRHEWLIADHIGYGEWSDIVDDVSGLQNWNSLLLLTIKTNGHIADIKSTTRDLSIYDNLLDILTNKSLFEKLSKLMRPTKSKLHHPLSLSKFRICEAIENDINPDYIEAINSLDYIIRNFAGVNLDHEVFEKENFKTDLKMFHLHTTCKNLKLKEEAMRKSVEIQEKIKKLDNKTSFCFRRNNKECQKMETLRQELISIEILSSEEDDSRLIKELINN